MKMIENLIDFILPKKCFFCKKNLKENICFQCLSKISVNNYFYCPKCFKRTINFQKTCHLDFNYFLSYLGLFKNEILKELIHQLKYKNPKKVIEALDFLIEKYVILNKENLENFSNKIIIIPIPLHFFKKFLRGFNQSEIIAEIFQKHLNSKTKIFSLIYKNALKRIKNNPSQTNLNYQAREKNVLNIFKLQDKNFLHQKYIILIDDVLTSGATIKEAIKILKQAKPKKILVFTLAKN